MSSVTYSSYLKLPDRPKEEYDVSVTEFTFREGYNLGWVSDVTLSIYKEGGNITIEYILEKVVGKYGIEPGLSMTLCLEPNVEDPSIRTWPCVVNQVDPLEPEETDLLFGYCNVRLVDPVTYLANRPIWGAYRACSVGNMIGGALSMAKGGSGRPTLTPMLDSFPPITIKESFRSFLNSLPYSIAVGQTFGEWLGDIVNELGLRIELLGVPGDSSSNDSVILTLSDEQPAGTTLNMTTVDSQNDGVDSQNDDSESAGRIYIVGFSGYSGIRQRATLLDSITENSRNVGAMGGIGRVLSGPEISVDEAARRADDTLKGAYTEMLQMVALSRQPGFRTGRTVNVSDDGLGSLIDIRLWQLTDVEHFYKGGEYDNTAKMIRGDVSWHPTPSPIRPPILVSGIIDDGADYGFYEPVPRDRLGRIFVNFPFTPTPTYEELQNLAAADTNEDQEVTLSDYSEDTINDYSGNSIKWERQLDRYEEELKKYGEGNLEPEDREFLYSSEEKYLYEDIQKRIALLNQKKLVADLLAQTQQAITEAGGETAYNYESPLYVKYEEENEILEEMQNDIGDTTEVTDEERAKYEDIQERVNSSNAVIQYRAYKEEKEADIQDRDGDGYVSDRDELVSDELSEALRDEEKKEALKDHWEKIKEEKAGVTSTESRDTGEEEWIPDEDMVREYGVLFDSDYGTLFKDETTEQADAREDAKLELERWPPRIPLSVIEPMAGGRHGFIPSHRQGDTCRVAVYGPLWAEIVGFQYRDSQSINATIVDATAGLVVEHDRWTTWSGMIFNSIKLEKEVVGDRFLADRGTEFREVGVGTVGYEDGNAGIDDTDTDDTDTDDTDTDDTDTGDTDTDDTDTGGTDTGGTDTGGTDTGGTDTGDTDTASS